MHTSTDASTTCLCEVWIKLALRNFQPQPDFLEQCRRRFHMSNENWRLFVSETFCTAWFLFIGLNAVAQVTLSNADQQKEFVGAALGWSLALVLVVYMGFYISGAHMNPAVTLVFVSQRRFPLRRFLIYAAGQHVGAFIGAAFTYLNYYDAIHDYDSTKLENDTLGAAKIFATYPSGYLSTLSTAILVISFSLIIDPRTRIPIPAQPALFGVMLAMINFSFVHNAGCAMNPVRDFMPRLFTFIIGYGHEVFSYNHYEWFWVPIVCPMIGSVVGAWTYSFFIGFQLPDVPKCQKADPCCQKTRCDCERTVSSDCNI